jgi:UDP-N-acetylmuramoylalanine--D-glutamate ligase
MQFSPNTTALILGLGDSGLAMARWCARMGAAVVVADTRAAPPQLAALQADLPNAKVMLGTAMDEALLHSSGANAVFKSPGLAPHSVAGVMQAATAQGLWCGNELSLFNHALAALKVDQSYNPNMLAITGTNGKTTVTSLTLQLLQRAGMAAVAAGNIGPSLLDTLGAALDAQAVDQAIALPQAWVLELSSFQLDGVQDFCPTAATVLNITQDHLDWHGDMAAYAQAKQNVYGPPAKSGVLTGLRVLNRDEPHSNALVAFSDVESEHKGKAGKAAHTSDHAASFGSGLPQRVDDWGIEHVNGMDWLVRARDANRMDGEEVPAKRRNKNSVAAAAPELIMQRLMPVNALRIRGRHNALNALAALALASSTGANLAAMLYGLREYVGEPHRVQSVAVLNEVEYFDDSKGTNVGATVAAISGLGAERRLVLILGGDGKGQDFAPLAAPVAQHARAVALIGRDAALIQAALEAVQAPLGSTRAPMQRHDSLDAAVHWAAAQAQRGDAVLLSPACASLDMFRNYAHRAEVFCNAVGELA